MPRDQTLTYEGEEAVISGFGYTWIKYEVDLESKTGIVVGGELSKKLKYAKADIISTEDCRQMYNKFQPVYMVQICSKLHQRDNHKSEGVCNVNICLIYLFWVIRDFDGFTSIWSHFLQGDSGSPLVYRKNIIIGVVSRGPLTCSEIFVPSRHTRVSSFVQFIDNVINGINADETQRYYLYNV